jgi:hypothetical protein
MLNMISLWSEVDVFDEAGSIGVAEVAAMFFLSGEKKYR